MNWLHRIRLPDGTVTPGTWDQSKLESLVGMVDVKDKTVLDVGALDGKWGLECHARGASAVVAIDPEIRPTWREAHAAFGSPSTVKLLRASLEDYPALGNYGVVLDMGVYYHVENVVAHFKALHWSVAPGGMAVVEGEIATDEQANVAFWYPKTYENGDPTTRWVPSLSCLRTMMEYAGLTVLSELVYAGNNRRGRAFLTATRE
jgi:tRNA (mo5U34)-methyltransferase